MTTLSERTGVLTGRSRALVYLSATAALLDALVMGVAVLLAALARRDLRVFDVAADVSGDLRVIAPLLVLAWIGVTALCGGYRADVFGASTEEYKRVFNASLLTAGVLGVACYLLRYQLSRGFFVLVFLIGVPCLILGRFVLRRAIHGARHRGALLQRVLIVGSVAHIDEIAAVLRRDSSLGYEVLGALTPPHQLDEETGTGIPVLGNADDVLSTAQESQADAILFAGGGLSSAQHLREIIWELEHEDFRVVVAPSVSEISSERITVRPVGGLPLLHIEPPTWGGAARIGKRLFDTVGASLLILLGSPLLLFSALRIRLHDGGPVLFRQVRIGKDGAEFACLKFRTMVTDAEALLPDLMADAKFEGGLFKLRDDPRITPPGRWLRRFSIDELPQLFNVLKGEMSLVGPRPPLPSEVLTYEDQTSRRLRVRPGLTGLWQVSGRSDLSFEEAIRLDLYYVDNWSMLQDLSILFRTLGAVLSSRGAY